MIIYIYIYIYLYQARRSTGRHCGRTFEAQAHQGAFCLYLKNVIPHPSLKDESNTLMARHFLKSVQQYIHDCSLKEPNLAKIPFGNSSFWIVWASSRLPVCMFLDILQKMPMPFWLHFLRRDAECHLTPAACSSWNQVVYPDLQNPLDVCFTPN